MQLNTDHMSEAERARHDYSDGAAFKKHPLYTLAPSALRIFLYYDDLEV